MELTCDIVPLSVDRRETRECHLARLCLPMPDKCEYFEEQLVGSEQQRIKSVYLAYISLFNRHVQVICMSHCT